MECKPQLIAGLVFDGRKAWNVQQTQILMQAYMAPPPDYYLRVTLEQVHRRFGVVQIHDERNKKWDPLTGRHRSP